MSWPETPGMEIAFIHTLKLISQDSIISESGVATVTGKVLRHQIFYYEDQN